jgi:hypothetical protein
VATWYAPPMYHFGGYLEETYFVRCIGLILGVFQRMNLHDQIPGMHAFRTKHRCSSQPFRFFPLSRVVPHHSADSGSRFSRSYCPIIEYSYQPKILTFLVVRQYVACSVHKMCNRRYRLHCHVRIQEIAMLKASL